ncbi:MAG: glycosyltransferase [Planctomycetaceae bacterium]
MYALAAMHLLIIPSWYPTPIQPTRGTFFREQAQALSAADFQVGVIAPQRRSLRWLLKSRRGLPSGMTFNDDRGVATYSHTGWSTQPFWPTMHTRLWLRAGHRLFEHYIQRHGRPDMIHAHSAILGGVLAAEISERHDIPFVLTEHSTSFARGLIRPWQKLLVERAFRTASARLAVSPALGTLLAEQYPKVVGEWEWVPNMVDPVFRPSDKHADSTNIHRPFRWLNVALLTEKKGHSDLLLAFAEAFAGNREHELRIGGAGPERARLQALAGQLGIADQVRFLSELSREQVVSEMQQCDAFVLPSHVETFGVVLIEAMACGKPVIATRCGGPECFVNESCGILVPPRDPTALASAMRSCADDYLRYPALKISHDCLHRFSGEAVVRQLHEVYDRVLWSQRKAVDPVAASFQPGSFEPDALLHDVMHEREQAA